MPDRAVRLGQEPKRERTVGLNFFVHLSHHRFATVTLDFRGLRSTRRVRFSTMSTGEVSRRLMSFVPADKTTGQIPSACRARNTGFYRPIRSRVESLPLAVYEAKVPYLMASILQATGTACVCYMLGDCTRHGNLWVYMEYITGKHLVTSLLTCMRSWMS